MSIRTRLVLLCVVISLLPALPLSLLVRSLLEKSFDLGLSQTVEKALESGTVVSRKYLESRRAEFESAVEAADATTDAGETIDGIIALEPGPSGAPERLPAALERYRDNGELASLIERTGPWVERRRTDGVIYFEAEDRSCQAALVEDRLYYSRIDPEFIDNANRLIEGRQIFAQLRLSQPTLSRSFFYPFIIVYAVILVMALTLALYISERLSQPIRRLSDGAHAVAEGDWTYRLNTKSGGEVGRLVTAFNAMVSRLDKQQRRLVDMERVAAWRDMARHLAHEIKNPLLPIRLTVQELKDQYKGDDAKYRDMLGESTRVIGDELNHLTKLVKEFSSFARMPDIKLSEGRLEPLVRDVARLYSQISTRVEAQPDLPAFPFDPDQIRIVIVNLFENTASVIEHNAQVQVSIGRVGGDMVMMFSDNGPGIAADDLPRVFDPYFTTREEGTGLGLAMVKNIVLLHGGSVHVHSAVGRGATFTIALPMTGPDPGED